MRRQRTSTLTAAIDSLIALALAVTAVVLANQQSMTRAGIQEFLEMRVTFLNASFSIVFAVFWKECLGSLGLYRDEVTEFLRPIFRVATACGIMTAFLGIYLLIRHSPGPVGLILSTFFVAEFIFQFLRILLSSSRLGWNIGESERVLILGSGRRAAKAWRELRIQYHGNKRLIGFVDDRSPSAMPPDIALRYMCPVDELPDYLLRNVVDVLIVALPMRSCYDLAQRAVSMAETAGVRVVLLNDTYGLIHSKALRARTPLFVELVPKDERLIAAETVKRAFDLLLAAIGLMLMMPTFVLIAIAIKLTSPGPVFFLQERYGHRRRLFRMWKFRSMVANAPALMASLESQNEAGGPIFKIKNDPRITPVGRFLRRTSLDELPQLLNVLLGDMSLVGPRPMSVRDVSLFTEAQLMRRFSVRPGITGSWQVSGRSSLSFEQWISLDFGYMDEWSLSLDLKILARTVPAVLKRSGAA
jgi:exopolysaccharide biosynthesis polyprenyl glycosylphosphotransferase